MEKTILSLMKIYSFRKVLINESKKIVDFIIIKRDKSLTLNDWINLNIALKQTYHKKVNFLSLIDAKSLYDNDLTSFKEVDYE